MPNKTPSSRPFLTSLDVQCDTQQPELIVPDDAAYDHWRLTPNERFDYRPNVIAKCKSKSHVKWCVDHCRENGLKFRVRAGGHHQEGMSSADGVWIIDLSGMKTVEYLEDGNHAWIPPGMRLKDLSEELENRGFVIPVGICDSVFLGGLVAGGGWGLSNRRYGYTCDSVVAAEVVLANGDIVIAEPGSAYHDLLRAILGGGGGNFGVVTRFKFILHPLVDRLTKIKMTWDPGHTREAARKWARFQAQLDANTALTLGGKISVGERHTAILQMSGVYYGELADATRAIAELLTDPRPREIECVEVQRARSVQGGDTPPAGAEDTPCTKMMSRAAQVLNSPNGLEDGCNGRHGFKVSSAFPVFDPRAPEQLDALMDAVVRYIEGSSHDPCLFNYVSLLGCGGEAQRERGVGANAGARLTCVPPTFRERPFMLKLQAWWRPKPGPDGVDILDTHQVDWIRRFRATLAEHKLVDGAFINFQDVTLVPNSDTAEGRLALLRVYHQTELEFLLQVKKRFDPHNSFSFGMSLPL
ncbi:putative oxidoreductase [Enhygromyxa salina]|uniref:Putative oxidoreductase n=1 Tax=Enhygromyxa salina TaxID=215803 RepID=A0A0C2CUM9_9BACT|nr:putative oxidoreductase [Enhygromyxa salina]